MTNEYSNERPQATAACIRRPKQERYRKDTPRGLRILRDSFSVHDAHETRYIRNMAQGDGFARIRCHVEILALATGGTCRVEHLIEQIDVSRSEVLGKGPPTWTL